MFNIELTNFQLPYNHDEKATINRQEMIFFSDHMLDYLKREALQK
jgi:hypothetical protein